MCSMSYLLYEKMVFIRKLHEIKICRDMWHKCSLFLMNENLFVNGIDMQLRKVDGC